MNKCPNCNHEYFPEQEYKCSHCGEKFWKTRELFEKHLANINKEEIKRKKLKDEEKDDSALISMTCKKCGHTAPQFKRWIPRIAIGILLLWAAFLPGLIFWMNTNPWICPNCDNREFIIKNLNNGMEEPIKSKSKSDFLKTFFIWFAIIIALIIVANLNSF